MASDSSALFSVTSRNYSVQFGETVLNRNSENVVGVAEVIPHAGYLPLNQYINDIGVVKFSKKFPHLNDNFRVNLPIPGSYFATGTPSVLTGWGLILQEVL